MDVLTLKQRRLNMSRIRSRDTCENGAEKWRSDLLLKFEP